MLLFKFNQNTPFVLSATNLTIQPTGSNLMSEADTCNQLITPALVTAGWNTDPHSFVREYDFTDGQIIVTGQAARATRRPKQRADYLLRYTRDFPIAVVEAKDQNGYQPGDGLQQAIDYATTLKLRFAYATNGLGIVERDLTTGQERTLTTFPTPAELWQRLTNATSLADPVTAQKFLEPMNLTEGKIPRYYQQIAINRAVEAILSGQNRLLLTMATGTGKTVVAFNICWKLWHAGWNAHGLGSHRKPKILFLADRNVLIDDPKDLTFRPFDHARHKITAADPSMAREMYFSTYQSLAADENRPGLYRQYPPDFFDLIVIDECHRGSASDESNWREILEYFQPAYQLGLTATPRRADNTDTYRYFGQPIYTYSLKQGIADGFLAPYRVRRITTTWDADGWRPLPGELDQMGQELPDRDFLTPDFERTIIVDNRTLAIAQHLTNYLRATDPYAKTIVFCVDQRHALAMREALNRLNPDITSQHPDYIQRITSNERYYATYLGNFKDLESRFPSIVTTSQLLTTGVDIPTCKNVVLLRDIQSITEFKQIIGRGTRVRQDYDKLTFTILDYTGCTRLFADPDFDGEPVEITEEAINDQGDVIQRSRPVTPAPAPGDDDLDPTSNPRPATTSKAAPAPSSTKSSLISPPTAPASKPSKSPVGSAIRFAPSTPPAPTSASAGSTTAPPSSTSLPGAVSTSTSSPPKRASPTPTPSTSSATSPTTPPSAPAATAPPTCASPARTSSTYTPPPPAAFSKNSSKNTPPTAPPSS
jgi:type I restriction enzyme R subunit